MAFHLCEQLGFPHPDYLLPLLTFEQWFGWGLYYREKHRGSREPLDEENRNDFTGVPPDEMRERIAALRERAAKDAERIKALGKHRKTGDSDNH